jgi:hypothetical protein
MTIMNTMGSSSLKTSFQAVNTIERSGLNIKSKTINSGMEVFMSYLLVLLFSMLLLSCSTTSKLSEVEVKSPGYQYGRQMDERFLRTERLDR